MYNMTSKEQDKKEKMIDTLKVVSDLGDLENRNWFIFLHLPIEIYMNKIKDLKQRIQVHNSTDVKIRSY